MLKHALLLQHRRQFWNQCCNKRIFFNISDNFGKLVLNMRIFFKICDNFGKYLKTQASFQHLRQLKEKRWNMRILSIICENYGNILKYAYILQQRLTICEKVEGFSTSAKILETMSKHALLLQHLRQFQEQCCNRRFFLKICENISKLAETHASTSTSAIILGIMLIQSHLQHFRYFRKQC